MTLSNSASGNYNLPPQTGPCPYSAECTQPENAGTVIPGGPAATYQVFAQTNGQMSNTNSALSQVGADSDAFTMTALPSP